MIRFEKVCKRYPESPYKKMVLDDVNFSVHTGQRLGIFGINGSGKSTLIRLASGLEKPSSGIVTRTMSCSWPIGFGGAFQTSLTGEDNIRFISRIYAEDFHEIRDKVADFTELGSYLRAPVRTYSTGMKAKFAFGLSIAIDFDCLLIDEVIAVGDERFTHKCFDFMQSDPNRTMIFASHVPYLIEKFCNQFAMIINGKLEYFSSAQELITFQAKLNNP
jgi:capsular polysaccharide transport system ATP-binding protein